MANQRLCPKYPRWSESEIDLLKKVYSSFTEQELSEKYFPIRTVHAIRVKAKKFGLKKSQKTRLRGWRPVRQASSMAQKGKRTSSTDLDCRICGSHFVVENHRLKKQKEAFCSAGCAHKAKAEKTGIDHPLWTRVERSCKWCGSKFHAKPAKVNAGEANFCSRQCVGAYSSSIQDGRRSSIEILVEKELQRLGVQFIAQKKMGHFLCDFYIPKTKTVIECDGDYWHAMPEVKARDARKDSWLAAHKQNIVRLTESEINADVSAAVKRAL